MRQVCINKTCTSLYPYVDRSKCPTNNVALDCSGRGVCSNVNTCFCDPGWTGHDCSTQTNISFILPLDTRAGGGTTHAPAAGNVSTKLPAPASNSKTTSYGNNIYPNHPIIIDSKLAFFRGGAVDPFSWNLKLVTVTLIIHYPIFPERGVRGPHGVGPWTPWGGAVDPFSWNLKLVTVTLVTHYHIFPEREVRGPRGVGPWTPWGGAVDPFSWNLKLVTVTLVIHYPIFPERGVRGPHGVGPWTPFHGTLEMDSRSDAVLGS